MNETSLNGGFVPKHVQNQTRWGASQKLKAKGKSGIGRRQRGEARASAPTEKYNSLETTGFKRVVKLGKPSGCMGGVVERGEGLNWETKNPEVKLEHIDN